MGKLTTYVEKYKYVILVLAAGILLMLLPWREDAKESKGFETTQEGYSLSQIQSDMEELLRHISGVGQIKVMLTLKSGSALQLAENRTSSRRDQENKQDSEIVKLNRGSGSQDVVITEQIYPTYQGAVIVCQGAENPSVKLAVTEAVAVLTGLSSEKITVVKWES